MLYYASSEDESEEEDDDETSKDSNENEQTVESEMVSEASEINHEVYPWYRRAPYQHQIGQNYLKMKDIVFTCRPQKPLEANGLVRSFPKRMKVQNVLSPNKNGNVRFN